MIIQTTCLLDLTHRLNIIYILSKMRIQISLQVTSFGTGFYCSEMGNDSTPFLWKPAIKLKGLRKKAFQYFVQD